MSTPTHRKPFQCGMRSAECGVPRFRIPNSELRTAFTLVELLTVITIIGILAGLATAAAFKVMTAAKQAAIRADINSLERGISAYKEKYGDYPPSNMLLKSDQSARDNFIRHISKARPKCNPINELNALRDPPFSNGPLPDLTPSQALVFWLTSMSNDAARPISAITDDRVSLLDFDKSRITQGGWTVQRDANGKPIALNTYVPQTYAPSSTPAAPYVYFEARLYLWHSIDPNLAPQGIVPYLLEPWDTSSAAGGNNQLDVGQNKEVITDANGNATSSSFQKLCASPKSFQIISAGLDADYGKPNAAQLKTVAVQYPFNGSNQSFTLVYKSYPSGLGYADEDNDNICSFSDKALGDAKPQ